MNTRRTAAYLSVDIEDVENPGTADARVRGTITLSDEDDKIIIAWDSPHLASLVKKIARSEEISDRNGVSDIWSFDDDPEIVITTGRGPQDQTRYPIKVNAWNRTLTSVRIQVEQAAR